MAFIIYQARELLCEGEKEREKGYRCEKNDGCPRKGNRKCENHDSEGKMEF